MLVLSEADVEALVTLPEAIGCAREAYRLQASGEAGGAVRGDLRRDDPRAGCLLLAGASGSRHLTVKSNVHAYPDGPSAPRLWGSLLALWDWSRAEPRALISARAFNDHRTASGFAAAAMLLAPPAAGTLALFGAGKSAPMTARYLKAARPSLQRLCLVGRSLERVEGLRRTIEAWPDFADVEIVVGLSPAEAVAEADIVATVTTSDTAVFPGAAVKPGALVILGGANRPTAREADDALMRRADVFLDASDGALQKAGDLVLALRAGALETRRILGEIGTMGDDLPRFSEGADVRVFKSMGLAIQDATLAVHLVERAEARGLGVRIDLAGQLP